MWQINALTDVDIPYLRIKQQLLLAKLTFKRDGSSGSTTVLELKDPKAYQPEPKSEPKGGGKKASGGKGGGAYTVEAEQDLQARFAGDAAASHRQIKDGR